MTHLYDRSSLRAGRAVKTALRAFTGLAFLIPSPGFAQEADKGNPYAHLDVSTEALIGQLKGFESRFAEVNGTRLHYVEGGEGSPVVLLPGWPQTWWAFRKIMPDLAEHHHVIAVDIRGMGASDKPDSGYDKENMARDIHELVRSLGYEGAHIVGHDIGSHVAYPYAVQYPETTLSVTYLDVAGLPASVSDVPLLPSDVLSGDFNQDFYLWWFAFHQVQGMPEELLEGRAHIYQQWFWDSLLHDQGAVTDFDRAVFADAYNSPDAIRAGNGWYQTYPQDLADIASYPETIDVPSLGLGGIGYGLLREFMESRIANPEVVQLDAGHYIAEEAPEEVSRQILDFLDRIDRR